MNPTLKNILAVVIGFILGSVVNMAIISLSASVIPPPVGADVTTMEGLKAAMHLFEPRHFLMPFLAHALGTLTGAFVCAKIAAGKQLTLAMVVGLLFCAGGIANVIMLPSPVWFTITDLVLAYFPMAYLGYWLAKRR